MSQLFHKSLLILLLFSSTLQASEQIVVPEISTSDEQEATKLIKDINSKKEVGSEVEDAERILEKSEEIKEEAKNSHAKSVSEILNSAEKSKNSPEFKKHADWIKENQNELFAKQAKPLPKIDYDITAKEREKDSIAKLLNNYRFKPDDIKKNQVTNYPLMIFVSASIPKSSLKDLMIQAKKSGGVLVFRGLIGTLRNTQQFLGEIAKENVSAIIDPRLFDIFKVEVVPTFVILGKSTQDCEKNNCNFTPAHDRITGNITLEYALEQFANGDGEAKTIASVFLAKMQGGQK